MINANKTKFIVQTAGEAGCKWPAKKVAILEVDASCDEVSMISERAKGVVRVVYVERYLSCRGKNTAFQRALDAARAEVAVLNNGKV